MTAVADIQQAIPCIKFRQIKEDSKFNDTEYRAGHFLYVLKPTQDRPWCVAQNTGARRRHRGMINPALFNADYLDQTYLRTLDQRGFNGPSLFWMGHCETPRWIPKILQELVRVLGLQSTVERPDALRSWRDPWSSESVF